MTSDKSNVKRRLFEFIKELVSSELEKNNYIPEEISGYLLKHYNCLMSPHASASPSERDMNMFVTKLESLIGDRYDLQRDTIRHTTRHTNQNFLKLYEKFKAAKQEYFSNKYEIIPALDELIQIKIKYSFYLNDKSILEQKQVEVMTKKIKFLELKSLLSFYSENDCYSACVVLRQTLEQQKKEAESALSDLQVQEKSYEKLKDNKEYCKLQQIYKQLIKKEKQLDFISEV